MKPKRPVVPANIPLTPGLRRYLYVTAAVTGAAIMIVEILGAKMLAPYLGTSHFVWTAQIAVTLVALACGYYIGGRWVDRSPQLGRLYGAIAAAAVYLCVSVLVCEPVAYQCLEFELPVGSLLASAFLFFVPLGLLAMVGPFFVRMLTGSVETVGGNVGRLTAISTAGSVVGTVLIGYVLIPFLPNSVTMYLTALALMAVAVGYFAGPARKVSKLAPILLVVALGAGTGYAGVHRDRMHNEGVHELYRANSNFGQLQVVEWDEEPARRSYLNDFLNQNSYDPKERKSVSMYTYMLHGLARAYTPRIADALCIGLGVGIVPSELARDGARVDVVEINPAVLPVGVKYFDLEPQKLNIHFGDGRYFVSRCQKRYDTIILDAFLGDSSPSHLFTREAFMAMRRLLRAGGTLVINIFGATSGEDTFFTASLAKTLGAVFQSVRIHQAGNGNTFLVAANQPTLTLRQKPDMERVHPNSRRLVTQAFSSLVAVNLDSGIVLTDDYNPVDFYDAKNRERLRRYLALQMKDE
ncbi:MAG: fused MFS/spermidine synthase [Verrucomicrobia bacterium]|nr:fused MFS/spermidine synthase [Verrucomicrobiota bacterium]